jgi:hypothetical protein
MKKLLALLSSRCAVLVDRGKHWPGRGWSTSTLALAVPVGVLSLAAAGGGVFGPDRWAWGSLVARWAWG